MHLYSNNLSAIAKLPSLIMSELFPACFSCSKNFNLSQSCLGFSGKNTVEIPESILAGDLSNLIGNLSLVLYYLKLFDQSIFLCKNSNMIFLSDNLARSTL